MGRQSVACFNSQDQAVTRHRCAEIIAFFHEFTRDVAGEV